MRFRALLGGLSVCLLLQAGHAFAQDVFRWRDAQGQVHYSNMLPPEAVDRGYEVLNGSGFIVKRVPAPLTPAQRAAAEAKAQREREAAAARAAQARHGYMLLQTFDSVKAIERLRDDRLGALDAQRRLLREHLQTLVKRLDATQQRRAALAKAKRTIPRDLAQQEAGLKSHIEEARKALQALHNARNSTLSRFNADIARYKQLKARE